MNFKRIDVIVKVVYWLLTCFNSNKLDRLNSTLGRLKIFTATYADWYFAFTVVGPDSSGYGSGDGIRESQA